MNPEENLEEEKCRLQNSESGKVIAGNDLPNSDLAVPLRFNIHAAQIGEGEDWGESLELTLESLDFRIRN